MFGPILIAGPTASGKSRLAIDLARRHDGMVINADSMQVYTELRVLSARPDAADIAEVPHSLYGHVPAAKRYSVGRWIVDVAVALGEARAARLTPILVGGTGLYFKALTEGLATIPPIPSDLKTRVSRETGHVATDVLHARLASVDSETAAETRRSDRSRILRALEVWEATGRPLAAWRRGAHASPLIGEEAVRIVIAPERPWLHERIGKRADAMLHDGALDEVRRLAALGLPAELPAMKAIGVRQFLDHFDGKLSLDEALASVKTETRRYAKRQETWFRNQMADWRRLKAAAIDEAGIA